MDYICTLFKNDPQFWSALISIVLCFCFRAYRLERDNIHYSSKEAGQRTLLAIAVMIILSLCLNSEQLIISEEIKEKIQIVSVMIYCGIAFFQTIDNNHPERNGLLSIVKFILVFAFSTGSNGCKLVLSTIALLAGVYYARSGRIVEDVENILHTEIVLLSAETLVITICTTLSIIKSDVASIVMLVLFTETVLYSINYTVVFSVKERLFFVD